MSVAQNRVAADKLAATRLAIIEQIHRRERHHDHGPQHGPEGEPEREWEEARSSGPASWFASVRRAASAWWRHHPAHLGVELAMPALSQYASRKPVQFLAIAAGLGVVAVVARPWRLISVTGLLVALAKSSQLSSLLMSAMSAADYSQDQPPRR